MRPRILLLAAVGALVGLAASQVPPLSSAVLAESSHRVISAGRGDSFGHWTAADPLTGRVLAVWLNGRMRERGLGVMARLLDSSGRPLAPAIEIGQGWGTRVAFDAKTRRYLVIYGQQGLLWGRLLDAGGKPLSDAFPVAALWQQRNEMFMSVLAADGNGMFLAAWSDDAGRGSSSDVFAQWISAEGRPVIAARPSLAAADRMEVIGGRSIVFDPVNKRFAVVWYEGDRRGVRYCFVYPDGRITQPTLLGLPGIQPSLALDAEEQRFLLAWEDGFNREPRYRLYDLDFNPVGEEGRLPGRQRGVDFPNPAFDPVSGRFLITWRNDFYNKFFGQWLDRRAEPIGKTFIAARLGDFTQHQLTLPHPGGGFLMTYEDRTGKGPSGPMVVRARTLRPSDRFEEARIRSVGLQQP